MKQLHASRPLAPDVRSAFLAEVEATLDLTFLPDTEFEYCDDGRIRHVTPNDDKHPNKFGYIVREKPFLHIRYWHYPSDGGVGKGRVFEPGVRPQLSDAQQDDVRRTNREERKQIALERQRQEAIRRAEVTRDWEGGQLITDDFTYFKKKDINGPLPDDWKLIPHRFRREHTSPWTGTPRMLRKVDEPAFLIPLRRVGRPELVTVEYVAADGAKDYAYGLPTTGATYIFGEYADGQPVYVCEGIVTGLDIHRLTGCFALCAGGAGNLKTVAKDVRLVYGAGAQIVICAERGYGYAQGADAAQAVGGVICTPPFESENDGTDFNDYRLLHGDDAARDALQNFQQPTNVPLVGSQDAAAEAFMEDVNRDNFIAIDWAGGTRIGRRAADRKFYAITETDLKLALASRRIPGISQKPHLFWLAHPGRRQYGRVAYDPEGRELQPQHDLNLWTGFAVQPNSDASWDLLKHHIKENICSGDERAYNYLMHLMAYQVQHPGRPSGTAVILRGIQGCGKSTLLDALLHLYGRHGLSVNRTDHLAGQFSGHLEQVSLVTCNEVGFANAHEFNEQMKSLITDPRIPIHHKGRTLYDVPNTLNFWFATNKDHAANMAGDNRRMLVLEVRDAWPHLSGGPKDNARRAYFGPLRHQMVDGGGYGAMLHELLTIDLIGFNVGDFPRTQAAAEQVEMSMTSLDRYFVGLFREGEWRPGCPWVDGQRVDKKLVHGGYEDSVQKEKYPARPVLFWKRARELTGDPLTDYDVRTRDKVSGIEIRRREIVLPILATVKIRAATILGVEL